MPKSVSEFMQLLYWYRYSTIASIYFSRGLVLKSLKGVKQTLMLYAVLFIICPLTRRLKPKLFREAVSKLKIRHLTTKTMLL